MRKSDLEMAALNQKARAERLEVREADLEHALNLLVNNAVEWFYYFPAADRAIHRFGVGVAMNVPVENKFRAILGRHKEHRIIIFWKTEFPDPVAELTAEDEIVEDLEGNRKHNYLTIYNLDEFKTLPKRMDTATSQSETEIFVIEVKEALKLVDDAVTSYLRGRRPLHVVM